MTNGDYIRSWIPQLNNSELARIITSNISCCGECPAFKECNIAPFRFEFRCDIISEPIISEDCQKNFQNWLNSEKEENK